jgi:hypothetical protein
MSNEIELIIFVFTAAGDNTLNLVEADAGFVITGTTGDVEDGRAVTATLADGVGVAVGTYMASVCGNAWSVGLTSAQATALANGGYKTGAETAHAFLGVGKRRPGGWQDFRAALDLYGEEWPRAVLHVVAGAERTFPAVGDWLQSNRWKET